MLKWYLKRKLHLAYFTFVFIYLTPRQNRIVHCGCILVDFFLLFCSVCLYKSVCLWRPEIDIWFLPELLSTMVFETGSHDVWWIPGICLPPALQHPGYRTVLSHQLSVGTGHPYSGVHAYPAWMFHSPISPAPFFQFWPKTFPSVAV